MTGPLRLAVAALAAVAVVLMLSAPLSAAPPRDPDVRACIVDNPVRYLPPEAAVAAQYQSIEDACHDAVTGVQIVQSDAEGGAGDAGRGAPAGGTAATPQAGGGAPASGGTASAGPRGGATAGPTAEPAVRSALAVAESGGVPRPWNLWAAPAWLLLLVAGLAGALAAAAVTRARRHRP